MVVSIVHVQRAPPIHVAFVHQIMDVFFSERFSLYRNVVAIIGAVWLLRILSRGLWELANAFRAYFLAPWGVSRKNLRKCGSWASELITINRVTSYYCVLVVTGASEGIGREYALEVSDSYPRLFLINSCFCTDSLLVRDSM